MASRARAVLARIKSRKRLVNEPQFFFLTRDQSGVHFEIAGRARDIHLVRRGRLGFLFLVAPQLFDSLVGLVAKPHQHISQQLAAVVVGTLSFACHILPPIPLA